MELRDMVFVSTPGTFLRLDGDALRVVLPDKPGRHLVPLHRVESIVLWNGVEMSPDALHWCMDHGIHVTWITQTGKLHASLTGHEPPRPELRIAQVRAYDDPVHRVRLAQSITAGKLQNYRQLLLRAARDATGSRQTELRRVAARHDEAVSRLPSTTNLTEILGIEGRAARDYFAVLDLVIDGAVAHRVRRPPTDQVNCYLSATYGLLRSSVHSALVHVGLDPHVGFIHGVRGPRPTLALDLMEELRALMADRLVATMFNRGQIKDSYWRTVAGGAVLLTDDGWKHLLGEWTASRMRPWPHKLLGRKVSAAEIPYIQARAMARHLREPGFPYTPWLVA